MPDMRLAVSATVAALHLVLAAGAPAAAPAASAPQGAKMVLPFHEDAYAGALAEARAKKLPLFIEAWAPW